MGFASLTLFVTRVATLYAKGRRSLEQTGEGRGVEEKASRGFFPWNDREIGVDIVAMIDRGR